MLHHQLSYANKREENFPALRTCQPVLKTLLHIIVINCFSIHSDISSSTRLFTVQLHNEIVRITLLVFLKCITLSSTALMSLFGSIGKRKLILRLQYFLQISLSYLQFYDASFAHLGVFCKTLLLYFCVPNGHFEDDFGASTVSLLHLRSFNNMYYRAVGNCSLRFQQNHTLTIQVIRSNFCRVLLII